MAAPIHIDPIHQFQVQNIAHLGNVAGYDFYLTNSALYMLAAIALITVFLPVCHARQTNGAKPHAVGCGNLV